MADEPVIEPVTWAGVTYKPLADGRYDAIILGTGLKECILSGLLSMKGKKVCFCGEAYRHCWCSCLEGLYLIEVRRCCILTGIRTTAESAPH
jgi:hypothetical protein